MASSSPWRSRRSSRNFAKEALDNSHNLWVTMVPFIPDLSIIPAVLATHFPGDEDVYGLLGSDERLAFIEAKGWPCRNPNEGWDL